MVGNREMLRRLRAAEMAAWEAARPNTAVVNSACVRVDESETQVHEYRKSSRLSIGFLLLLAACGSVALSLDLLDFSLLYTGWSQLLSGIRSLLS